MVISHLLTGMILQVFTSILQSPLTSLKNAESYLCLLSSKWKLNLSSKPGLWADKWPKKRKPHVELPKEPQTHPFFRAQLKRHKVSWLPAKICDGNFGFTLFALIFRRYRHNCEQNTQMFYPVSWYILIHTYFHIPGTFLGVFFSVLYNSMCVLVVVSHFMEDTGPSCDDRGVRLQKWWTCNSFNTNFWGLPYGGSYTIIFGSKLSMFLFHALVTYKYW